MRLERTKHRLGRRCGFERLQSRELMAADVGLLAVTDRVGLSAEAETVAAIANVFSVEEHIAQKGVDAETDPCAKLERQVQALIDGGAYEANEHLLDAALTSLRGQNYDLAAARLKSLARVTQDPLLEAELKEIAGTSLVCEIEHNEGKNHAHAGALLFEAAELLENNLE